MLRHPSAVTVISEATERGLLFLLSIVPAQEQVLGRKHSAGTAAVFKVLELGRELSVHHFLVVLPVITWNSINCWFTQRVYTAAAFAVIHSYSFRACQWALTSGDVFGCWQPVFVSCARPFTQPCPVDFTHKRVSSIFCFFSKSPFQTANVEIQTSRLNSVINLVFKQQFATTETWCDIIINTESNGSARRWMCLPKSNQQIEQKKA